MPDLADLALRPEDFSGKVRLFPLPGLVLFPHVIQPLHIFEPRYRTMFEEAMAGDRLIAMTLLAPGWEADYEGRPPIEQIACLGRVATYHKVEEGRYNLLLLGLRRIKITRELPPNKPFREAYAELLDDEYPSTTAANRADLVRRLVKACELVLPQSSESAEQLDQFASNSLPLGTLTDIVAFTIEMERNAKYALLSETNVDRRATQLLDHLSTAAKRGKRLEKFPPDFSAN